MENQAFQNKLNELVNQIDSIPTPQRDKLVSLVKRTCNYHKQLMQSANSLQESLDYLRTVIKYLLFDLEATRRENAQLKKLIEDNDLRSSIGAKAREKALSNYGFRIIAAQYCDLYHELVDVSGSG